MTRQFVTLVILILSATTGVPGEVSKLRASKSAIQIRDDFGHSLSSVFSDLKPATRPVQLDSQIRRNTCRKQSGLIAKLSSFLNLTTVHAATCIPGACGGRYFVAYSAPCGYQCMAGSKDQFQQRTWADPCSGWQYDGTYTCGACQDCQQTGCSSCP